MTEADNKNEVVAVGHNLKKYYSVKPSAFSKTEVWVQAGSIPGMPERSSIQA